MATQSPRRRVHTGQDRPLDKATHAARKRASERAVNDRFRKDEGKAFIPDETLELMKNSGYKHPRAHSYFLGACCDCLYAVDGKCAEFGKKISASKSISCHWWKPRK